jgi:iron-sulfur cluster repair protein YtfE (RIC family)
VTAFLLRQLGALTEEAERIGRMAAEHRDAALGEALERLRHRLPAHVRVVERLLFAPLRDHAEYRDLLVLEEEHDGLEHRTAEIQHAGCDVAAVADFARDLRAHIENESRVLRTAAASSGDRLAGIPGWRAEELFECAGGPTRAWPGEWLG